MSKAQSRAKASPPDGVSDAAALAQVRDILFGAQARALSERLTALEQRVGDEQARLRKDIDKRFDELHAALERGLAQAHEKTATETSARADAVRDLSAALDTNVSALRESLGGSDTALRAEMQRLHAEQDAALRKTAAALGDAKTDRSALAALLGEVARRLGGDDSEAQ